MLSHTLDVLEYPEALGLVAGMAASPLGAAAVRALTPRTDVEAVRAELAAVGEMIRLSVADERWAMPAIPDVREPLRALRIEGSVWDAPALWDAGVLLASSRSVKRALSGRRDDLPALAGLSEALVDAPELVEEIRQVVSEAGEVKDDASRELARLRREIQGARSRIVSQLTAFAASLPSQYQVSDALVSIREGRYVVPVRREGRGEVGGIVHGESGSGATLFIEPPLAIELMNRLRGLEAEEAREVQRLLRELTARLRPHREAMAASLDALVRLDSLLARARYAIRYEGTPPEVFPAGASELAIVEGRHPLLLAKLREVVPFDLRLEPQERTLLISGPNTGGKTVLLKALGLLSLMAQAGVVPPVGPGTRLPVFGAVFADIGDEQSIEASLSTFSAHLRNLRETLEEAGADSLVLIDEIGSGTDPLEGAALARAILVELTRRGVLTVATTHLGQLKLLATEDPRVVNASLQFDADKLEPTYRLSKGIPGRSYGLAIARRLGLPHSVLADAEAALPEGERDVGKLLIELEARDARTAEDAARLERQLEETRRAAAELEERERKLLAREKETERRARQQARDLLMAARREVEEAIEEVRSVAGEAALEEAARAARRRVEEAAERQRQKAPAEPARPAAPSPSVAELTPGTRVRVESIGQIGTVVEVRDGKVTVEASGLRLVLPVEDLTLAEPEERKATDRPRQQRRGGYVNVDVEASHEIDLRGLRVDELELRLNRALDAAILSGLPSFRIIHGKGTGALRAEVRDLLAADPRITTFRAGERGEGGTGVTVVEF